ncbi:xylose repressor [Clostridium pasteurianum DSM 525 = ATCC 6013]|uniref:ROK family protein n=1 Tax=Clostridium pasteurianum DSM 525 = ATCC 6013 TaxID=1262449 RepID=A0A0H3J0D3_CLOPA|nr:ROK family transcriptional regulator [Clostridium pasteurianum]AJA46799.1 xylose repressor [Clostridium pasteurianum DSM 525 = ATCC 6013]AJA50787.1 xylose repressor [Clostridium pasteurianum DSM 525 = ATCC 6013]AOZ74193.1 transcriptional regulator [Clostridium pasteurianum DSM 525 = ATCC 6013]AOZ77991.1 transcriptional regulator [Clostridium pasteurianum]ELP58590.1 hypothetical protein F502_13960 [Clostridium pasteurianum DSM 525 = ATCC 6013]
MKDSSNILKNLSYEQKRIFNLVQKKGHMTKNEISKSTNIKLTTLKYIMEPLEKFKLIVESRLGESTGGRKPVLYDVNLSDFYIIGIDISIMYTQVSITDLKMNILYKDSFYMDSSFDPEKTVDKIVEIIDKCYVNLNLQDMKLLGIGLGSVGPLDIKNGIIKNPLDFYSSEWENVPIKQMLEKKLNCPVTIENGVNAAAIAEYFYGVGKGIENIAFFNCGIGIRTGTISSGNLIRSINDEEEAFSHMIIEVNIDQYRCRKFECIENYSSIKSMIKKLCEKIRDGRQTIINKSLENIDFDDICRAVEEKDELSIEIITEAASILGIGLANYIRLLNPKLVILSGPLIMKSELFYDLSIKSALEKLNHMKGKNIIFNRCGYFKKDAISVGAASMVIERCIDSGI